MRRSLLVSLAPLSALLVATFACDDTNVGGNPNLDLDAGNLDAFVPPVPQVDASTPAPITVSVQVVGGTTRAGLPVVFEYTDGKLETIETDANGLAVSAGATTPVKATALLSYQDDGERLAPITWLGIAGGDVLQVRGVDDASSPIGTFNVTTAAPSPSFATAQASTGCDGSGFQGASGPVDLYGACLQDDAKATLLGLRVDEDGVNGFAFLKDLAPPAVAGTALTLGAWTTPDTLEITAQNIPVDTEAYLHNYQVYKHRTFNESTRTLDGATPSFTVPVPAGFATSNQVTVTAGSNDNTVRSVSISAPPDASKKITVDLAKLPAAVADLSISGEPRNAKFAWTGDTAGMTGGILQVDYTSKGGQAFWTFVVPAGTTSVTLPSLPADAGDFAVRDDATIEDDFRLYRDSLAFVKGPAALTPALLRAKAGALGNYASDEAPRLIERSAFPVDGEYLITGFRRFD